MKKIFVLCLALFMAKIGFSGQPDEGMWIPLHLKNMNEADMKKLGLKLGADGIYDVSKSSVKDAIVRLNNGSCTAEIVSGDGLVFTNHHCAYGQIWEAIKLEKINKVDYKANGFWSRSKEEEIGDLNMSAGLLNYIEKITDKIYPILEKIEDEGERDAKKRELAAAIEKEIEGDDKFLDAQVKEMFEGNEYYVYVYKVYKDVRLVASPPESIGKFGGDTDNWMWPRHTGDFAILRIYANDKNEACEYDAKNKPYKPKHFLPVSIAPKKKGDFSMIMGFPGTTERYLTSYDLNTKLNYTLPARVETRDVVLNVMEKYMAQDDQLDTRLKSRRAQIANYWKLWSGQVQMARLYDLTSAQQKEDMQLKEWIEADNRRINRFGSVLAGIENYNKQMQNITPYIATYTEGFFNTGAFITGVRFAIAADAYEAANAKNAPDGMSEEDFAAEKERQAQRLDGFTKALKGHYNSYFDMSTVSNQNWTSANPHDLDLITEICLMMYNKHPKDKHPKFLSDLYSGDGNDEQEIREAVQEMFEKSIVFNKAKGEKFLNKFKAKKVNKDAFIQFCNNVYNEYQNLAGESSKAADGLSKHRRLYLEALMKFQEGKAFYPDANSSMRLTYGTVLPYDPRDAVSYAYTTTHHGVLEKNNPNDPEFTNSDKTLEMFRNKKFGQYGVNDTLTLCFLTNHDITGGNSGSPVIDGSGNLIGIAFDGNWEAATSDFLVMPNYNRTISVDIRYVLWVIDEFADCNRLIKEMKIVHPQAAKPTEAVKMEVEKSK